MGTCRLNDIDFLFRPSYPPPQAPERFSVWGTTSLLSGSVPEIFKPAVNHGRVTAQVCLLCWLICFGIIILLLRLALGFLVVCFSILARCYRSYGYINITMQSWQYQQQQWQQQYYCSSIEVVLQQQCSICMSIWLFVHLCTRSHVLFCLLVCAGLFMDVVCEHRSYGYGTLSSTVHP